MTDYTKCNEILIDKEKIARRVHELAEEIKNDFEGEEIYVIGVLRGAFVFMSDLTKEIELPMIVDFITAKSYEGTTTTGNVKIIKDVDVSVEGKNVILVEDIIDTGCTLSKLIPYFESKKAKTVRLCALLNKPSRRIAENLKIDYKGFDIPDAFVVGYGLDFDDYYRNFPEIRIYNPDGGLN